MDKEGKLWLLPSCDLNPRESCAALAQTARRRRRPGRSAAGQATPPALPASSTTIPPPRCRTTITPTREGRQEATHRRPTRHQRLMPSRHSQIGRPGPSTQRRGSRPSSRTSRGVATQSTRSQTWPSTSNWQIISSQSKPIRECRDTRSRGYHANLPPRTAPAKQPSPSYKRSTLVTLTSPCSASTS